MNTDARKYYLFTLVNISEDLELNGEFENKLFVSFEKARRFMEYCIQTELSAYSESHQNMNNVEVERVGDNMVNLWLDEGCNEGVLYRISDIRPT